MNKFFTNKGALVTMFKLAPNPTEELRKFRFNKIMQMLEEAKGVSRQMYLEEGMPTIPEGKMESFIDDAIQSEKGMTTRIQNNWTEGFDGSVQSMRRGSSGVHGRFLLTQAHFKERCQ